MGNGYFADSAFEVHPNGHDYDAIGFSHGHIDGSTSAAASSIEPAVARDPAGADTHTQEAVIDPPPRGDCSRKKVSDHIFVERVCGPERRDPDEIRIIEVIPPVTALDPNP